MPDSEYISCFRFHAFAERTKCIEFSAFSTEDVDSSMTWNSRKLKGRLPPGTWNPEGAVSLITLVILSALQYSLEIKDKAGTAHIFRIISVAQVCTQWDFIVNEAARNCFKCVTHRNSLRAVCSLTWEPSRDVALAMLLLGLVRSKLGKATLLSGLVGRLHRGGRWVSLQFLVILCFL